MSQLYAMRDPDGKILGDTVRNDRDSVWSLCYSYVAESEKWGDRYWKKWSASLRAAEEAGWTIVRVNVIEAE